MCVEREREIDQREENREGKQSKRGCVCVERETREREREQERGHLGERYYHGMEWKMR